MHDKVAGSMSAAKACEIYGVVHRNSLLWKWRYTSSDGSVTDCAEEFRLFLQCTAAARACGYEPRSDWTGPCALLFARDRRSKGEHPPDGAARQA
jgi:hypothetical protein